MQVLIAPTEDLVLGEQSNFSADEAVGQTVLSCYNAQGLSVNDFVILGRLGSETSEIHRISSIASDLLTITLVSSTKFSHSIDEQIIKIRFDKRKFYRSTTKTGTYSHLSSEGSPVDIEVDKPEGTEFEDSSGSSSSWYKVTYYNSYTGLESSTDDATPAQAGDTEHYTSIFKIKDEAGFKENSYLSTETVQRYRLEAEAQVESAIVTVYSLPLSEKPKLLQHIVTLLAGGLLLSKEYGMEADVEISKTGERKIKRAEELLQMISDGKLTLLDSDGSILSKSSGNMASGSNVYDSDISDQGELFNLGDEHFNLTDPEDPLASSIRSTVKNDGFD